MIYYNFKNYEEFKEIFGIIEHGNGVKSRKNKILLSLYKNKDFFKLHLKYRNYKSIDGLKDRAFLRKYATINEDEKREKNHGRWSRIYSVYCNLSYGFNENIGMMGFLEDKDMSSLKSDLMDCLHEQTLSPGCSYRLRLNKQIFYSNLYRTDDMDGLCEDGTLNAIRYVNIEKDRVYKMKAGKMFNHIMSCNEVMQKVPEQIQRWLSEEFVADWIEYSRENVGETKYHLHLDDNFEDIYDSEHCAGYENDSDAFGSCMVNDDQWTFYRDAVEAKAAYLTDDDDMIVARCIVFTEVKDQNGKVWRLAERQYSKFSDDSLKRQLVTALIRGGHIDGYKRVGSSCHDARAFVDNEGNSLADKEFHIKCNLEDGDTLSYQDSFKWYDPEENIADNYCCGRIALDVTDSEVNIDDDDDSDDHEYDRWSEYNQEYIHEDDAVYVDSRDDYFWYHQTEYAYVWDGRYFDRANCFEEDCVEIDGEYYYAGYNADSPLDYGMSYCPHCDSLFVPGRGDSCYSDLTEKDYCCCDCKEEDERRFAEDNGFVWAEYDDEWVDTDYHQVLAAYEWIGGRFCKTTITSKNFNYLVGLRQASFVDGVAFLDRIGCDGEPRHYLCVTAEMMAELRVA